MRILMSHERSELTYPSETVPPIQAGFATAMNRPLCSFVSAMRFGAPQRQDIENPSCRSVRFDLRGLFLYVYSNNAQCQLNLYMAVKILNYHTVIVSISWHYCHVQLIIDIAPLNRFQIAKRSCDRKFLSMNNFNITTSMIKEPQESTVHHKYTPTCQVYTCICTQ